MINMLHQDSQNIYNNFIIGFIMNFSDYPTGKSPRKELQLHGPRPTPLKLHKDSHKIKKPPQANLQQPQNPPRQPVIIYTVSPKIIHTHPDDFMNLVQRLTGLPNAASSSPRNTNGAATTMEQCRISDHEGTREMEDDDDCVKPKGMFSGILSPAPGMLPPPVPSNFFSLPGDSFFHDLSPVLHGNNRNFIEGSFMPSPSNFSSPTPYIDLFNNFS